MSFVNYTVGAPGYSGSEMTVPVGNQTTPPFSDAVKTGYEFGAPNPGDLGLLNSPIYNTAGIAVNGWQTLQTGGEGGGGSTRPTSGMIYPRGTG